MGSPMALLCWKGAGGGRGIAFRWLLLRVAMDTDAEAKHRLSHHLIFYSGNSWVLKEWPSASVCNRRSAYSDIPQIGIICIRSVLYEVSLHFGNVQIDWNHDWNFRGANLQLQVCWQCPKHPGKQQVWLCKKMQKKLKISVCLLWSFHQQQTHCSKWDPSLGKVIEWGWALTTMWWQQEDSTLHRAGINCSLQGPVSPSQASHGKHEVSTASHSLASMKEASPVGLYVGLCPLRSPKAWSPNEMPEPDQKQVRSLGLVWGRCALWEFFDSKGADWALKAGCTHYFFFK